MEQHEPVLFKKTNAGNAARPQVVTDTTSMSIPAGRR
jgi:hypothetical protein